MIETSTFDRQTIFVGPAGWHYKDWYGPVYPAGAGKDFKELDYLSLFFDTAEINSTFYKPANAFMAHSWVRKVEQNPRFKFTTKLFQQFTHERGDYSKADIETFCQGIDPLVEAGRLGALLVQFPWSFRNNEANRSYLFHLLDTFSNYPVVLEVRHSTWDVDPFYASLNERNVSIAAIDQPVIGDSIPLKAVQTGNIGYVRLHGRNYQSWFPPKGSAPSFARYDYLYNAKEIGEISQVIKQVAGKARETYVIQNNHPRGQALANSAQLRASLGDTLQKLPDALIEHYEFLKELGIAPIPEQK